MKKINKYYLTLFLLFIYTISFSQHILNQPLEPFTNSEILRNNNIKSLTVFREYGPNKDIRTIPVPGDKNTEIEYLNGNIIYIAPFNSPKLSLIIKEFDSKNNELSKYEEGKNYTKEKIVKYDSTGKIILIKMIHNNDTSYVQTFKWEKEKLINHMITYKNENIKDAYTYDEKGKLIKFSHDKYCRYFKYKKEKDTLKTIASLFISDTLHSVKRYSKIISINRIFSYQSFNYSNKLIINMRVKYDEKGNATQYYLHNLTKNHYDNGDKKEDIRIVNIYSEKNLLIKRKYFKYIEKENKEILEKVERYFYDIEPLSFKYKKGTLAYWY